MPANSYVLCSCLGSPGKDDVLLMIRVVGSNFGGGKGCEFRACTTGQQALQESFRGSAGHQCRCPDECDLIKQLVLYFAREDGILYYFTDFFLAWFCLLLFFSLFRFLSASRLWLRLLHPARGQEGVHLMRRGMIR